MCGCASRQLSIRIGYHLQNQVMPPLIELVMGKPHFHWVRMISVDESLREYKIRLTRGWVANVSQLASKSMALSEFVYYLANELRSVELTASMSHTVVAQFEKFTSGFISGSGETSSQQVGRYIATRLTRRVDIPDKALRENILAECLAMSHEVSKPVRSVPGFSAEDLWKEYLSLTGFKLALSASQSQGIAAAYNAYETFLVRCVGMAIGKNHYRKKSDERFVQDFTTAFGVDIVDRCFSDVDVQLFRALRHAICHNGGRETNALINLKHVFTVKNGDIQFMPQHTVTALRIVQRCAKELVAAAAKHPAFARKRKSR